MADTKVTSNTPPKTSGVNGGIRIVLALLVGIAIGIFMLSWDAKFIGHENHYPPTTQEEAIMAILDNCVNGEMPRGKGAREWDRVRHPARGAHTRGRGRGSQRVKG